MRQGFPATLPVALLAILVLGCGTFYGSTSALGAISHQVVVLLFCLLASSVRDPLHLGPAGRWLPAALLGVVTVGLWFSPFTRAGLVGWALLPAYLLIPSAAAWCWSSTEKRRAGLVGLSLLTLTVGLIALGSWQFQALERAAQPLGHHNLLAGWLILVLPVVTVGLARPGRQRWLAGSAGLVGSAALLASGSLLGVLALTAQVLLAAVLWKRLRWWLVATGLLLVSAALPRFLVIVRQADMSTSARISYLEAGWRGLQERPLLGWGPGSVPWSLGEFLRPQAGLHPASQIVGDLHSLPAQIAYELGVLGAGLTLAIGVVFSLRRRAELRESTTDDSRRAALLGLIGGAVFCLGSAPLTIPALPVTAALVAGLTLPGPGSIVADRRSLAVRVVYLLAVLALLLPVDRAHLAYDQARSSPILEDQLAHLERARQSDPTFPLYRARWAWLAGSGRQVDSEPANEARQAAILAPGLAPLWLAAGDLGRRSGQDWAPQALARAFRLDPLSALTTFHWMTVQTDPHEATRLARSSLEREPRLAAADWWAKHPEIAEQVGRELGISLPRHIEAPGALAVTVDRQPATSFSLYAFRRRPWLGHLARVGIGSNESTTPNTSDR